MKKIYICCLCLCLLQSGCMMGPNYRPPENCIPETWVSGPCCDNTVSTAWWKEFNDPLLDRYIEAAACYNNDVLLAGATIYQAWALRQIAASQLFPQINSSYNASRTYFSKNGPAFAPGGTGTTPGFPFQIQIPLIQNLFTALINVSWEFDFFGKIRRRVEAAEAIIGSAVEERNSILISIFAEVALNYIDLRSAQQKGILIEENLCLLEEQASIVRMQWEKGIVDKLSVENIEAQLADLRASLPLICAQIYQDIYALSILIGGLPETLLEELLPIAPLPKAPSEIGCGLRSELLRRRPDVRQAERDLAAATANIGVAVASFFPTFSFIGDLGLQSLIFRQLFQTRSNTWSIGGGTTLPIYQGGNLVGNLRLSEGEAAAAAFAYQQTILTALGEAEGALMTFKQEEEVVSERSIAVERYAAIEALTSEQFEKGYVSLINVLDSSRQLNSSKQDLLDSETTLLSDLITLYKALGGGWEMYSTE